VHRWRGAPVVGWVCLASRSLPHPAALSAKPPDCEDVRRAMCFQCALRRQGARVPCCLPYAHGRAGCRHTHPTAQARHGRKKMPDILYWERRYSIGSGGRSAGLSIRRFFNGASFAFDASGTFAGADVDIGAPSHELCAARGGVLGWERRYFIGSQCGGDAGGSAVVTRGLVRRAVLAGTFAGADVDIGAPSTELCTRGGGAAFTSQCAPTGAPALYRRVHWCAGR